MKPNFLIVGAAKCGTSSLDRYLSQHPEVFIPPKKEAHYYSTISFPERFRGPGDDGMNQYTIRDQHLYEDLFTGVRQEKAVGESSVFYLFYPGTAERIYADIPDAKIIIMLRNPIDRAFSAYMHLIRDEREHLDFGEALQNEERRKAMDYEPMWLYKELGLYSRQVKRYFDVFGESQVKTVIFEEFVKDPQSTLVDLLNFLDVDSSIPIDTSIQYNVSGKPKSRWIYNFISKPNGVKELIKPFFPPGMRERLGIRAKSLILEKVSMDPVIRSELESFYADDIVQLENLLNHNLSIWRRRS